VGVKNQRSGVGAWWLLLFVPIVLIVVILFPHMGEHGEGLLPETIGAHLADTEEFQAFAADARRWGGTIFGLSCLVGILIWLAARNGWRNRLLLFDATKVRGYRGFIFGRLLLTILLAVLLTSGLILLSSTFRILPIVAWVMIAAAACVFAGLQYFATIWGVSETRRLFRGR
jgi:hypothetical protein